MASSKSTDGASAPTDEIKATREKSKTAGDGGPVLVFNAHLGPYVATETVARKNPPTGAGKDDPKQRLDVFRIVILPGLCLLDADTWARCSKNRGFAGRVAAHALVVVNDEPGESWQEAWTETKVARAVDMITETSHVATLETILAVEDRDKVRAAIEAQLSAIRDDGAGHAAARKAQRAHNRTARRATTRSGGLLS